MSPIPFCDLARSIDPIRAAIDSAISDVIDRSDYVLGVEGERFEAAYAEYCGVRFCAGVGNGFDALRLILQAIGIGPGDEVLVPGQTAIATWLAVTATGAVPIGVDLDPASWSMDPESAAAAVGPRTVAILPVHLYGHMADMVALSALASRHGLALVEDAAQAHGAMRGGRRAGSLGVAGGFSFYPTKNLGALGDGGAVITDDPEIDRKVRLLRNYGSSSRYLHEIRGVNSRLDEIQAAVLRVKLAHLDSWNDSRRATADRYRQLLDPSGIRVIGKDQGGGSVWHQLVVSIGDRDAVQSELTRAGIGTLVHYPVPPHLGTAFEGTEIRVPLGEAELSGRTALSLPVFPGLRDDEIDAVAGHLLKAAGSRALIHRA